MLSAGLMERQSSVQLLDQALQIFLISVLIRKNRTNETVAHLFAADDLHSTRRPAGACAN